MAHPWSLEDRVAERRPVASGRASLSLSKRVYAGLGTPLRIMARRHCWCFGTPQLYLQVSIAPGVERQPALVVLAKAILTKL